MNQDTEIKKTRKPHRCFWCGEAIEVGYPAWKSAWTWEREFLTGYWHPECWDALGRSDRESLEYGYEECSQKRGVAVNEYDEPKPAFHIFFFSLRCRTVTAVAF